MQRTFFKSLADDFEQHGVAAIERLRQEDRLGYIRISPRSDDELAAAYRCTGGFTIAKGQGQIELAVIAGVSYVDLHRKAAIYLSRILAGAKPSDPR